MLLSSVLDKFWEDVPWDKISVYVALGLFAALLITLAILYAVGKSKNTQILSTKETAFAGICLALSFALSSIRLWHMPYGGSVTPGAILPLAAYCYYFGFRKGLLVSFIYSILQLLQTSYIANPIQIVLDYFLPFMATALAALSRRHGTNGFLFALLVIGVLRYIFHTVSGYVFFAEYAPDDMNLHVYLLTYNLFVIIETAIAMILGLFLFRSKAFTDYMTAYSGGNKPKPAEASQELPPA